MLRNFQIITLLITGLFFTISSKPVFQFPGYHYLWHPYSDSGKGGNSENYGINFSDSCISWIFQLKDNDQHQWPFTGISRILTKPEKNILNDKDFLIAQLSCSKPVQVVLKLSTFDPNISRPGDYLNCRILEYPVFVDTVKKQLALPLRSFKVADWWKRKYNIPVEDNRLFLDSIFRIDMVINNPKYFDQIDTLRIFNLNIKHQSKSSLIILLISAFSAAIVSSCFIYKRVVKKPVISDASSFQLNPQQMTANPSDWDRILDYVQNNYSDPQISIQKVARELGFSDSKLSHIINSKYSNGFRCMVHELRINEGKRLLKESDMNISEIAYKLGYATPNHFNREFKKRMDSSPGGFRKMSGT